MMFGLLLLSTNICHVSAITADAMLFCQGVPGLGDARRLVVTEVSFGRKQGAPQQEGGGALRSVLRPSDFIPSACCVGWPKLDGISSSCAGCALGHEACQVLGERATRLGTDQSIYISMQFYVYSQTSSVQT